MIFNDERHLTSLEHTNIRYRKLIASQIDKPVSDIKKIEPIIALNWKEETTNVSINASNNHKPNVMLTEDDFSNVLISPIQIHNNQSNNTDSELRKTSSRQKKAPVNRSKDFFMATVTINRPKNLPSNQPLLIVQNKYINLSF